MVLIDAVRADAVPGRIRRCAIDELAGPGVCSAPMARNLRRPTNSP